MVVAPQRNPYPFKAGLFLLIVSFGECFHGNSIRISTSRRIIQPGETEQSTSACGLKRHALACGVYSQHPLSSSLHSSTQQGDQRTFQTAAPNKSFSRNRKSIKKRQNDNEIKLQSLSKSRRTKDALDFYHSTWVDYHDRIIQNSKQTQGTQTQGSTNTKPPIPPTVRLMNYAIDACARATPQPNTQEAWKIYKTATSATQSEEEDEAVRRQRRQLIPNVYTFGSLIRAYARIGDTTTCANLLQDMKTKYSIIPNSVIYSTIISACENVNNDSTNVNVNLALKLFQEATSTNDENDESDESDEKCNSHKKMDMNIVVYNTVLSVFAKGKEWKLACQLLDEMEGFECNVHNKCNGGSNGNGNDDDASKRSKRIVPLGANIPPPDHVTYGTVMAACERAKQWKTVLKIAERVNKHHQYQLDGVSISSALKACQQLGYADDALIYLNQMKGLKESNAALSPSSFWPYNTQGRKPPLEGPDDVAYRLAISACARSGYLDERRNVDDEGHDDSPNSNASMMAMSSPRWVDCIRLLREMEEVTGSSPDVIAYTAAIGGCAVAGEYRRAIQLLKEMRGKGVEPNVVTFTAVISACASACANQNNNNNTNRNEPGDGKSLDNDLVVRVAAMKAALSIFNHMTRKNASPDIQPNIVTYNAAIRACAEGLDVKKAFELFDDLKELKLEPTIVTYGTLMTACERGGDVQGAAHVFRIMEDDDMKPNEIVYGAAISCFRKASKADRTYSLLKKMIDEELYPNTATFNTVIMSQIESKNVKNAISVYEIMLSSKSKSSSPSRNQNYGKPNRQTFSSLIQFLATNSEPSTAEYLLLQMREKGMKPDVDLFTITVTAYEKSGELRKALSLMENMREDGYDFYDVKVLDAAFKLGIKTINNVVGNG